MANLVDGLGFEIATVPPESARRIARAYGPWSKGRHRAELDLGNCIAYDEAHEHACRLVHIGNGLSRMDIAGVL